MGTVAGIVIGVLLVAAVAWGQYGAIFSRQYHRGDPGVRDDNHAEAGHT